MNQQDFQQHLQSTYKNNGKFQQPNISSNANSLFKNIVITCGKDNASTIEYVNYIISYLKKHQRLRVFINSKSQKYIEKTNNMSFPFECKEYDGRFEPDYIIVIGNGQLLISTFAMFQQQTTPPILAIGCGVDTINFNFSHYQIKQIMPRFIDELLLDKINYQNLMKVSVFDNNEKLIGQSVSEIQIHRGSSSNVLKLNISLFNKCLKDPIHLAQLWGDGILIATPMGSTGRAMTLNGPIMHKQIRNLLIIPICPLSLKFRPICLPVQNQIIVEVSKESRAPGTLGIDGVQKAIIHQSFKVRIKISQHYLKLTGLTKSYQETWIKGLREVLSWAENYSSTLNQNIHQLP